jgi:hypothetical protein
MGWAGCSSTTLIVCKNVLFTHLLPLVEQEPELGGHHPGEGDVERADLRGVGHLVDGKLEESKDASGDLQGMLK